MPNAEGHMGFGSRGLANLDRPQRLGNGHQKVENGGKSAKNSVPHRWP